MQAVQVKQVLGRVNTGKRVDMKKILVIALLSAAMLMLAGCPAEGEYIPEIPDEVIDGVAAVDTGKSPVNPENTGELLAFSYSYGSYHEGYWDYSMTRMEDDFGYEHIYFRAEGSNGANLNAYAEIDQSILDDIAGIIRKHDIFSWNGFNGNDEDVLDGYGFAIAADYKNGSLAADGYAETPDHYEEGHAALSAYLLTLAEGMEAPAIENKEDIHSIYVNFHEGFSVNISYMSGGQKPYASYQHGDVRESRTRDEAGAETFDAYVDYMLALYTEYKDAPRNIGNSPGAYISIYGRNAGFEYAATIDQTRNPEAYRECLEKSLAIVGKTPDFLESEEFETEAYQSGFTYPELYFYDKAGLGAVVVNTPEQTVTVNGEVYTADRQTMLELYTEISGNLYIDFPFIDSKENELHGGYLEEGQTAQGVFDGFLNEGYVWMFGRNHKRDAFYLYGGKDGMPDGWQAAAGMVREVVEKAEAAG